MSKAIVGVLGAAGISIGTYGGLMTLAKSGKGEGQDQVSVSETPSAGAKPLSGGGPGIPVPDHKAASNGHTSGQVKNAEVDKLLFTRVDDFKNDMNKSPCVKELFKENDTWETNKGLKFSAKNKAESDKFFSSGVSTTPLQSCLVIQWEKEEIQANNKWTGKFTWIWTFIRGSQGFINFNIAEPSDEQGKLKFTGVFYLVGKKGNKWEIKYKKEVLKGQGKTVTSENLDQYFPKRGGGLGEKSLGNYWDFISSGSEVSSVCKEKDTNCNAGKPTIKEHKYKWVSNKSPGAKEIKSWTENFGWWKQLYEVESFWKLRDRTKEFKGIWSKEGDSQ